MPCSVRLAKHRVQRCTKKKHRVRKVIYKNIDYPLMLTVNPVYVLHAFLRNISEKILKCLLTNKKKRRRRRSRRRTETALSQYTNSI